MSEFDRYIPESDYNYGRRQTQERRPPNKKLQQELRDIQLNGIEGVYSVELIDSNIYQWEVSLFGAPDTLYEGGYFKLLIDFPDNYPYSAPSLYFKSPMYHPNISEKGQVCITFDTKLDSDYLSSWLFIRGWSPVQTAESVLLSVISLLDDPNTTSAANADAARKYQRWKDSNGRDAAYKRDVQSLVNFTQLDASNDGVSVPTSVESYLAMTVKRRQTSTGYNGGSTDSSFDTPADYYDSDTYYDDCDEESDEEASRGEGTAVGQAVEKNAASRRSHGDTSGDVEADTIGGRESREENPDSRVDSNASSSESDSDSDSGSSSGESWEILDPVDQSPSSDEFEII